MSTTTEEDPKTERRRRVIELMHLAAAKAIREEDPWSSFDTKAVAAERVIRHLYDPVTQTWSTDETIAKMEPKPFTHGAMRFCYRLKKRATPPKSSTNHRFHRSGWQLASNYVAKAYQKDGEVDTSLEAKQAIQNDILLQYEANFWARKFNDSDPPSKISFLRAYAIEFPDREGAPWFAVERFIAGKDWYGAGFVKHNTNSGFVDTDLRRVTPQVFSAHSFYASEGDRLVADIQGVGDLYTDPQVLSSDYRFGDGDLGPRGMALFFKTYRNSGIADAMGIPIFPLSKNELKHQEKYDDDEVTASEVQEDDLSLISHNSQDGVDSFQKLDLNRMRRRVSLLRPDQQFAGRNSILEIIHNNEDHGLGVAGAAAIPEDVECDFETASDRTETRSNLTKRDDIRKSIRKSLKTPVIKRAPLHRTKSDIDEVQQCLQRARHNWKPNLVQDYHRTADGKLRERHFKGSDNDKDDSKEPQEPMTSKRLRHKSALIGTISPPMKLTEETQLNLGKVHFQLAVLHGMGRFPEIVPDLDGNGIDSENPPHCAFSVLFHLSYAASLRSAPACLSLGRVHAGLGTHVSELLVNPMVPLDFEAAKDLLRRAMEASGSKSQIGGKDGVLSTPIGPRVASGCLLFQILQDERHAGMYSTIDEDEDGEEGKQTNTGSSSGSLTELMTVAQDTLKLFGSLEEQQNEAEKVKESLIRTGMVAGTGNLLHAGDRVEGDYFMEGTYYVGTVLEVSATESNDGEAKVLITVQYDDDGSSEALPRDHVRLLIPPTATQTTLGGPLSDEEAFGGSGDDGDDTIHIKPYDLMAELASLKEETGDKGAAAHYYQEAAERAVQDNKMKLGTDWSLKAAELLD